MKKDKKITLTICLKESTVVKIKAEAEKKDISVSALIEEKIKNGK